MDVQQIFKGPFKALINEDYSISTDTDRYQGVLEYALSKGDFSIDTGIYMLPSNLNLNLGKTIEYSNKILVSNTNMKIGSNNDINQDHKKLPMNLPETGKTEGTTLRINKPIKDHLAVQHEQVDNPKMLPEKHNDEKLTSHYNFDLGGWVDCLSFLVGLNTLGLV